MHLTETRLAEARERRDVARSTLELGGDPGLERKQEKITAKVSAAGVPQEQTAAQQG